MLVKVGLLHRKILYTLKGLNIFLYKILGFNSSNGPCENFLKFQSNQDRLWIFSFYARE